MNIFTAQHIEKRFANHLALNDVNIHIPEGSIYGLLGPNGAGKTTLIRIMNQITAPDKGQLFYYDQKLKSEDIYKLGYLPEERGLYRKMKVGEQAIYLAQLKGLSKKDAKIKIRQWFEKFEIMSWWDKKVEELSKGMQQKIQFVVTVLHEPKLLIFDEPFTGFDPINIRLLKKEILNLRDNGATIVFSTHDMPSVEELCDNITLINKGNSIIEGSVEKIKQDHKAHIFKIDYNGNLDLESKLLNKYTIIEKQNNLNVSSITLKIPEGISNNSILADFVSLVDVVAFQEILPNMSEIFIKLVEHSNNSKIEMNE
ncbi:MAG: ATP-binding cassette domain-containing protein [Bacteroidales bacterium]|nr:ATP-binding cassette domain-containing protein [Bacteroidales bacterium]